VSEEDLDKGSLYPPLNTIQKCSLKIATKVAEYAYEHGKLHVKLLLVISYWN
jgi:malate dehydrogenase (oxaloacetate-decarboxylating)(NADP+)